ncbi:TRAP transporter large permease [Desulfobacula sp.]|uniref:TRAP transporter large permease n=1 Tax=Desulfobacula sp. TaxID=2593537 RepID=UPI0027152F47|nr:TRAP transporter large permease [Desulfobacula sp.]
MDSFVAVGLCFGALLILIAIRMPISIALVSVSFFGIAFEKSWSAAVGSLSRLPFEMAANWEFSAAPMFLFMGFICAATGLTNGLFKASSILLSRLPGSLAAASVFASALFAAASGSSVATAAAMSRIAIPEMLKRGYDQGLACGTVAASGTLGSLIPPSILLILYGIYANVSIGKLFLAGVVPGVISAAIYILMISIRCKINPKLSGESVKIVSFEVNKWEIAKTILPLPIIIVLVMGSIFFGIATPTEAGAIGSTGAVALAALQGRLSYTAFCGALIQTAESFASIFFIIIGGALLTRFIAITGITPQLLALFEQFNAGPLILICATALVYILLGMFIDSIGLLLLTVPIFLPLANALEMNLIWYGVILIKLLEIGLITPPIGLNIFVIKSTLGPQVKLPVIFRGICWFIFMDLLTLILLVAVPALCLWLPNLLR